MKSFMLDLCDFCVNIHAIDGSARWRRGRSYVRRAEGDMPYVRTAGLARVVCVKLIKAAESASRRRIRCLRSLGPMAAFLEAFFAAISHETH